MLKISNISNSPLSHLGGQRKRYVSNGKEFIVDFIASPNNQNIAFITGLTSHGNGNESFSTVVSQLVDDLKSNGFNNIEYRADNEDGRGKARVKLFEIIKKKLIGY